MKKKLFVLSVLLAFATIPAAETFGGCEDCFTIDLGNGNSVVDCIALSTNNGGYQVCLPIQVLGECVGFFPCFNCFAIG